MPRKLTRKGGHAARGSRTLCGQPASGPRSEITCPTCRLILSASPHLARVVSALRHALA